MSDSRDRFLTATNELYRRQGHHATSMKQVTEAAGLPTGSLYHFFPGGKDDLAAQVLETSGVVYRELLEMIWDEAGSPSAGVLAMFDGAAEVLEQTDFIDPCPIGTVAREVASTNEPLRQVTHRVFDTWVAAARDRLMAAGIGASVAQDLAVCLVGAIEGAFVLARATRDGDVLRSTGRQMVLLVDAAVVAAETS